MDGETDQDEVKSIQAARYARVAVKRKARFMFAAAGGGICFGIIAAVLGLSPSWGPGYMLMHVMDCTVGGGVAGIVISPIVASLLWRKHPREAIPGIYGIGALLVGILTIVSRSSAFGLVIGFTSIVFLSVVGRGLFSDAISRYPAGFCPNCAYDLRGAPATGCPECGWAREMGMSDRGVEGSSESEDAAE